MLSKEEISKLKINVFNQCDDETIKLVAEMLKHTERLESDKQKLIEKLEKDIVNITKTLQDGKHCDDYSRNRLKAYRTKTKEMLSILKGK